ncbi:MAG: pyridoxal-phosphate dependent enzyme [Anaerolineales bacterium]|nr:pyridoxal-phosphate dependent enzyme [Anaerolineales bacterium]
MESSFWLSLDDIQCARRKLRERLQETPLLRLSLMDEEQVAGGEILAQVESLQVTGSFKARAALYALDELEGKLDENGVWTASAGNMGKALAWAARQKKVCCAVIVPHDAPMVKRNAIAQYGARLIEVPFAEYQQIQVCGEHPAMRGKLVHPFADQAVITAHAVLGWEILEKHPNLEAIFLPYGGGGLCVGVAQAARLFAPQVKIIPCEVETATPLTVSLKAGKPIETSYTPSFISGMGAPFVFPQMWEIVRELVSETVVVSLAEVRHAIRWLYHACHLVVEGAGAVSLAAAWKNRQHFGKAVCIITGGNIDPQLFCEVLKDDLHP